GFMAQFEYDPNKSRSNLAKHGIDFETAKLLWRDRYRVELEAASAVEPRSLVIGTIEGKVWSAIVTYRGTNIRIISVRRSRDNEVSLYER
ncbi:MAG: BrnT family toxin, partial [Nodosilinea sp.]